MKALPTNAEVWQWVDWISAFYDARVSLSGIKGHFDLLLLFDKYGDPVENPAPLSPSTQVIRQHIDLIFAIYDQIRTTHVNFRWSLEVELEKLSPFIVLSALWPHIYPLYLDRTLNLDTFNMQNWPAILYHPYRTWLMLYQSITTLARIHENLVINPRCHEDAFALCVSHPALCMTPTLWEALIQNLYSVGDLEYLREIGGSVEPLTWDEGYGEGVIVRLPWANQA